MPRVTEMFAFVCADSGPDDEGILAMTLPGLGTTPMVGADLDRVEALRPHADAIARTTGRPYRILRFALVGEL